MTKRGGSPVAPTAGRRRHDRHHPPAAAVPRPPLLPGLLGGIARDRARWSSTLFAVLALDAPWRGGPVGPAMDGDKAMIYLTGFEHIPVAPGRPPGRLFDLSRVEVLCAANEAARNGRKEMAAALYERQHRLLMRELAEHDGDGGHAA